MIQKYYKNKIIIRYDDDKILHFFSVDEFPGLKKESIEFKSVNNDTLRGNYYFYDNYQKDKLIIFCHGIGPGHMAYMQEINKLAQNGYLVLAYDNTGCGISEGKDIRGMSQSLSDLNDCINYLKINQIIDGKQVVCIGHSWGGYAVSNILNYQDCVDQVVVISGFVSFKQLMRQNLKGIKRIVLPNVMNFEKKINPSYYSSSAVNAIKNSKKPYLWIHSKDDSIVEYKYSVDYLKKRVRKSNINYLITENKKHNPNYKLEAVRYMNEVFSDYGKKCKSGELKTYEEKKKYMENVSFTKMCEQDDDVYQIIFEFINSK